MIARITRLLLLIELLAVWFFAAGIHLRWPHLQAGLSFVLGLTSVGLFRLAITANSFLLSRRYRSPTPRHACIGLGTAARLFFLEFFSSLYSSSWTMAFRSFSKRILPDPLGLPVLLVHGYGCNSGYWQAMSKVLSAARISHHAVTLEPVFGSIDDYLQTLHLAVQSLLAESGQTRIILIGHSMGGLACRAYLRSYGTERIAKVITIGTPHLGTALANHGIGKNVQQMAMDCSGEQYRSSEWLCALNRSENAAVRSLIISIYSHHDNIVAPQSSACLTGATNIAVSAIGHVTLAMHQQVQQLVVDHVLKTQ